MYGAKRGSILKLAELLPQSKEADRYGTSLAWQRGEEKPAGKKSTSYTWISRQPHNRNSEIIYRYR